MSGTFRPIYEDDAITFQRDTTSPWATLPGLSAITATNFQTVAGSTNWAIQVPDSISGLAGGKVGNLIVQVNFKNPLIQGPASGYKHTTNPLLNQPSMGNRNIFAINSGFTASWSSVGVIGGTVSLSAFNIPARYVRLLGLGVTALTQSNSILLWTDGMSNGN